MSKPIPPPPPAPKRRVFAPTDGIKPIRTRSVYTRTNARVGNDSARKRRKDESVNWERMQRQSRYGT